MAKVKGKFISLTGRLMCIIYKDALEKADKELYDAVGQHWDEIDPEGWYDTKFFDKFINSFASSSISGDVAFERLGKKIYPTIKRTVGLPKHVKTPLDLILYEAEGYSKNHTGSDVKPRKFIKKEDGHVIVSAPAPGYDQRLYLGVYLGILDMFGVKSGKVKMIKGSPEFEYEIKW